MRNKKNKPSISSNPSEERLTPFQNLTYQSSWEDILNFTGKEGLLGSQIEPQKGILNKKNWTEWPRKLSQAEIKACVLIGIDSRLTVGWVSRHSASSPDSARNLIKEHLNLLSISKIHSKQKDFAENFLFPSGDPISRNTFDRKIRTCERYLNLLEAQKVPANESLKAKLRFVPLYEFDPELISEPNEFPVLSDEFVTEFGYRSVWILENWLIPMKNFLEMLGRSVDEGLIEPDFFHHKTFQRIRKMSEERGKNYYYGPSKRRAMLELFELHFSNQDNHFPFPPFRMDELSQGTCEGELSSYTPGGVNEIFSTEGLVTFSDHSVLDFSEKITSGVWVQFKIIQTALYFVTGLLSGPRISEITNISPTTPVTVTESFTIFQARTFKLCPNEDGELRPWVIPQQLGEWLQTFFEMRVHWRHFRVGYSSSRFWMSEASTDEVVAGNTLHRWVRELGRAFGLSHVTDDKVYENFINHNLRKTISRFIAISMKGGVKYLFDLFGHKWIEMTIHYVNSPGMQEAIRVVEAEKNVIGFYDGVVKEAAEANKEFAEQALSERRNYVFEIYIKVLNSKGKEYFGGGVEWLQTRASAFIPIFIEATPEQLSDLSDGGEALHQIGEDRWCFKDAKTKGLCATDSKNNAIKASNCTPKCHFNVVDGKTVPLLEKSIENYLKQLLNLLDETDEKNTLMDRQDEIRWICGQILEAIDTFTEGNLPLPLVCKHELIQDLIEADSEGSFMEVFGYA